MRKVAIIITIVWCNILAQPVLEIDSIYLSDKCFGFKAERSKFAFICVNIKWTMKNMSDSTEIIDYPAYLHSEDVKPYNIKYKKSFLGSGNIVFHLTMGDTAFKENNGCIESPLLKTSLRKLKPGESINGVLSGRYYGLKCGTYDLQLEYTTEYQKNSKRYWRGTLFSNRKIFHIDCKDTLD